MGPSMRWIPRMADSVWGTLEMGLLYLREWCKTETLPHTPDGLGMQRQAKVGGKESDRLLGAWKDW